MYPNDSFYYDEFEYVTTLKIPESAKILKKDSSYPDFHGDYFSESIIELSKEDFKKLLNEIKNQNKLITILPSKPNELISFQRKIEDKEDRNLFLTFLTDNRTIIVRIDFT